MKTLLSVLSALAEPTRLGAVGLLWSGSERSVGDLMAKLGATQSRMSRHMVVLKSAGLVVARRDAQFVRYQRNPALEPTVVRLVDMIVALAGTGRRRGVARNGPKLSNGTGRRRRNGRTPHWEPGPAESPM